MTQGLDGVPLELRDLDPVRRAALLAMSTVVVGVCRAINGDRARFGRDVIANHRLSIRGPGRITVGDRANLFAFGGKTRLVTRTPEALIRVGENARLNGAFVQAASLIDIGPNCIVGQAHLMDSDMHSLDADRRTNPAAPVRTAPIVLEADVWVARGAAVLPGVRIGEGSVVGYGAVVASDVPPRVVVAGNPARVVRSLA
jgi:acetyltransferase-like isoleucine patch superfamily enzyme